MLVIRLRANNLTNAVGVIKEEMRMLDSLIIQSADNSVYLQEVHLRLTDMNSRVELRIAIRNHPLIEIVNEEVTEIPEGITIIATGPLTSPALAEKVKEMTGQDYLYFYDAAAPIVEKDRIDMDKVYLEIAI